jgi:hypothetical protein
VQVHTVFAICTNLYAHAIALVRCHTECFNFVFNEGNVAKLSAPFFFTEAYIIKLNFFKDF